MHISFFNGVMLNRRKNPFIRRVKTLDKQILRSHRATTLSSINVMQNLSLI